MTLELGPQRRIVVVCGSGGVGKTTVAAAMAARMAREGRRTIVMTVDPARRLAMSLGLPRRPGERTEVRLDDGVLLDALQLDTQRTFDELVERHAGSPERRDRILQNRFYRRMADTLSGTHEYMAMERMYDLATAEDWEAIVVDTPPTRSTLAFLDAPRRVTDFLGGRVFRWLMWPYRVGRSGARRVSLGARALAATVGRVAGTELLTDTAEFLAAFEGMYDGFKRRAAAVRELLAGGQTAFVVVTAPERPSLDEAGHFVDRLGTARMNLAGVVVNRWRRAPSLEASPEALEAVRGGDPQRRAVAGCLELAARLRALEARGRNAVEAFAAGHPGLELTVVPELPLDVHDRRGLEDVVRHLFTETV